MNHRFILITGTSSGVGKATAIALARQGYTVFAGVRKEIDGENIKACSPENIIPVMLDVTSDRDLERAFHIINQTCSDQGLFALINNAAANYIAPFEHTDEHKARQLMEVNFFGVYKVTQRSIPLLRKYTEKHTGSARIINISSMAGLMGIPWISFYTASKFALMGITESLRFELNQFNIKATALVLGTVKTEAEEKNIRLGNEALDKLPAADRAYYEKGLTHMRDAPTKTAKSGVSPEYVADKILQLLARKNPALTCWVGKEARGMSMLLKILPTSWRHAMMAKALGC